MDILELANNSFQRNSSQILKNVNWDIKKGEYWALIGPNGAGKTTLLKIISGNLWPSSGKVKVLGHEFGKTDLRELRKKIGWVSSHIAESISQNEKAIDVVLSGKHSSLGIYGKVTDKDKRQADELLKFIGASHIKDKQFKIISQGERQKVLIARALMAKPLILILDEPCSGLDVVSRKNLLATVSRICKEGKTTIVYCTHHFEEIVPEIGHVLMIKGGAVFMKGKSSEILNEKNLEKLFS